MHRPLLAAVAAAALSTVGMAQSITVQPWNHRHAFIGGGAGVGLYPGHLVRGTRQDRREQAYDWLFRDMNNALIRMSFNDDSEPVNDNNDPTVPNMKVFPTVNIAEGEVSKAARARNPNCELLPWAQDIPLWLRRKKKGGGEEADFSNPNLYLEVAEWWYMNMIDWKQNKGIEIRYLDVANEPDWNGFWGRSGTRQLLLQAVPALRNLCNKYFSTYGVKMPKVVAASCLSTGAAASYLEDFRKNTPAAWANIDVCSTHQYGGGYSANNYQRINRIRGDRGFFMSEMHTYHKSVRDKSGPPDGKIENNLEAALLYGRLFSVAVNGGCEAYCYFQVNTPSSHGFLLTPWGGTPSRQKVYYAAKQLTSLQNPGSDVVRVDLRGMPTGVHAVAYHKWGEQRCVVTITNATSSLRKTPLTFTDGAGKAMPLRRVQIHETSANASDVVIADVTFPVETRGLPNLTVPALTIRSYVVDFADMSTSAGVPVGHTIALRNLASSRYLEVPDADDGAVQGTASSFRADNGRFQVINTSNGADVQLISLTTGKAVKAALDQNGNPVRADGNGTGSWTRFSWAPVGTGAIELRLGSGEKLQVDTASKTQVVRALNTASSKATQFAVVDLNPFASGFEQNGRGCTGSLGVPFLLPERASAPKLGSTFTVNLYDAPAGGAALGFLGTTDQVVIDLKSFGAPGCVVRNDLLFIRPLAAAGPLYRWRERVPSDVRLFGASFHMQALALDAGANRRGWVVSSPARGRIGW